ncbi:MAG: hypothetical protein A2508_03750 [Candidatus Lambdaproteobacteria bacterium RIFOXYD12_FULL_49_8]|nr:MAG: hypothetical protein A2508_03750 [Candidatus Lambdaproteobacteria bacterium RIFOXYD12_FULL_49_8]
MAENSQPIQIENKQEYEHNLARGRDWEEALDGLFKLLGAHPHFLGIASNTDHKEGGFLEHGVDFSRVADKLATEFKTIIGIEGNAFIGLSNKIDAMKQAKGEDKDLWEFPSSWSHLTNGVVAIELTQRKVALFGTSDKPMHAYIIFDGRLPKLDRMKSLIMIHKVMTDKTFIATHVGQVRVKKIKTVLDTKDCRPPAGLIVKLINDFEATAPTITAAEKSVIEQYVTDLKKRKELQPVHEVTLNKLDTHFVHRNSDKV